MNQAFNDCLTGWNSLGKAFCGYAGSTCVQSALLVMLLFALDVLLRQRVRAVFRYCVWLLVLLKLVLPPTLSLPTGIGYWVGHHLPVVTAVSERISPPIEQGRLEWHPPMAAPAPGTLRAVKPSTEATEPAAPAAPAAVVPTSLTWQAIVFLLWSAGVLAFLALLAQRLRFVRGLIAASTPAEGELLDLLEHSCRTMGIRRPVGLRTLDTLPSPAVCGLRRPTILMPASLVEKLSSEGLQAALLHELAHIKRADLWVNAAQTFLQILYFYDPFVWLANAIIRRTCEEAVDETVLVTLGGQAKNYSNTLIDISEIAFWKADFGLRLVGVAETKRLLQGRIKHMLTRPIPKSTRIGTLGTIMILVVAAVLLPMARGREGRAPTSSSGVPTDAPAVVPTVTVELLGLREYPGTGELWWRADGTPVNAEGVPDFRTTDSAYNDPKARVRVLAVRLAGPPLRDVSLSWSLTNAREHSFFPLYQDDQRKVLCPIQTSVARFKEDALTTDLKVGIAAGAWKEAAAGTRPGRAGSTSDSILHRNVIYHESTIKDGRLHASATHLLGTNYDCRLVARGYDGSTYEPLRYSNTGGNEMRLCEAWFEAYPEQIRIFHLQARPYRWTEFQSIPLAPPRADSSGAAQRETGIASDVAGNEEGTPVPGAVTLWPISRGGNGHHYRVVRVSEGLTWNEANAAAQAQGGHLATITSAEENAFVFALMRDGVYWNGPRGPWIGGYQTPGSGLREGWHWVTGEPFVYSPWSPGQPNDAGGADETRLEYGWGATTPIDTWNDQPDWFRGVYSYVVEWEPAGPTQVGPAAPAQARLESKSATERANPRDTRASAPRPSLPTQPTSKLNAWVSLQMLEERVVVLDTLKGFDDHWSRLRHKVVAALSEKETLDYLRARLQNKESLPIRIHIYYPPATKSAAEDLRQQIFALAREANAERDTEVRLEPTVYAGSGESPFYLREGKIRTFYPRAMPRPDGGPKPIASGLVDPNDLEQHILWRLTMPKNLPLTFRIEYDQASSALANQVVDTAQAVAKRVGLSDLVKVAGVLVESVPESAFLGKWQALGRGIIQSVDIQPGGVCQALVGEGSPMLKPGATVTGTWVWTVREIQLDISDPIVGTWEQNPLYYAYRATINEEGNLIIERGEIWPQGSFMFTRPPQMVFRRVQ